MVVLGSTGSIGVNTLIIAKRFELEVEVLVAGRNINLLNEQIQTHKPKLVVVANKEDIPLVQHQKVLYGQGGILEALTLSQSKLVVNALVGFLGLRPTLKAIELGKEVALANKESLVVAGKFVDMSKIRPIDSEHFGLWYLLQNRPVSHMTVTASGGAFRDWELSRIKEATLADALKHPNWSMGQKITIDSATMTNKLFELLEAKWLFNITKLDAVIETKSLMHALVHFADGSSTAHFANPSMQLPIAFALLGKVEEPILEHVNLASVGSLEFREIDSARYPIWEIKDDILQNPELGVVINAANEAAIAKFLEAKCGFLNISKAMIDAFKTFQDTTITTLEDIFTLDTEVRSYIEQSY